MTINPIIPIWLMAVISVGILFCKRKGVFAYIRQIIIVILLFIINLRPMLPGRAVKSGQTRTDTQVLFVIDNTISMLAEDYNGNGRRIDAMKEDCTYIVEELQGARFSIITFHNKAGILSPFTDNFEHIENSISAINPPEQLYARGSSLNQPKELMLTSLKQAKEKSAGRLIVFFISDGEITDGSKLDSYSELADYIDGGAVLGYGTDEGGIMHAYSFYDGNYDEEVTDWTSYPSKPAVSKLDEGNLNQLAQDMGISYVHMTSRDKINSVLTEIKQNQNIEIISEGSETENVAGITDIYYYFAMGLLAMLILEAVLSLRKK